VNFTRWTIALALALFPILPAQARHFDLDALNARLHGHLVDYTHNHGRDNRIWSPALEQKRDLYVYLPPGFDPSQLYPVMLWFHGITVDERQMTLEGIPILDDLMAHGKLPPFIIAIPDGTRWGRGGLMSTHSGFLNSRLGDFEDYVMGDVWEFMIHNFPIRPERQAHVIAGVSMGGGAAFHHAIKHRDRFGVVFGIFPPLNLRWVDCHGRYFGNFDPDCWGWRTSVAWGHEAIGKFGPIKVPIRRIVYPLFGRGPRAIDLISLNNPIEMLDIYHLRPGELEMFVAYGGKDEFNIDAQVESFLYRARERCLAVTVVYDPNGRHNTQTARKFVDPLTDWLAPRLAPYSPPMVLPACERPCP
jgi:S-formylglutathione hydrolase FrmB